MSRVTFHSKSISLGVGPDGPPPPPPPPVKMTGGVVVVVVVVVVVSGVPSKTQGRACLIARTSSLVILNSISMANGSPEAGLYSPWKWSWMSVR